MNKNKLFRIRTVSDSGWRDGYMGVFKANSENEARQLASAHYKIVTTGFYDAEEVTQAQLDKDRKELEKLIEQKTKILN